MQIEKISDRYCVKFEQIPPRSTRARLRNSGFRWSASKRAWYGDASDDADALARSLCPLTAMTNCVTQADCLDVLPELPDRCVDFVLTDPPYVVGYSDRGGRSIRNDRNTDWIAPAFSQIYRVLKPDSYCVSFYGWNRIDIFMRAWKQAGFRPVGHIVFVKDYASNGRYLGYHHECAYLLAKGKPAAPANPLPDVQEWTYSKNRHHPTEKAVAVLEPLVKSFSKPGNLILDPFAGSASTAIAAREHGRSFIAIEMDDAYARIARGRLNGS